jgi:long-chain acyl-CoA synthetase
LVALAGSSSCSGGRQSRRLRSYWRRVSVYPLEVERALLEHPDVHDAAVFGVADERWGQRVCAAVVTATDVAELDTWLRTRVAPYKRPKSIVPVDAIPVTPTGKVRRGELSAVLGLQG